MTEARVERRLAAILAADVAGYSRLMGAEIAPELTGHGLPLAKCEAYNRVYDQHARSG